MLPLLVLQLQRIVCERKSFKCPPGGKPFLKSVLTFAEHPGEGLALCCMNVGQIIKHAILVLPHRPKTYKIQF